MQGLEGPSLAFVTEKNMHLAAECTSAINEQGKRLIYLCYYTVCLSLFIMNRCKFLTLILINSLCVNLTPWPESASELYRLSDIHLSAKLVPAFADRGYHVVSVTDPYGRILDFLDWNSLCVSGLKLMHLNDMRLCL
jgi:hypothetical protein